MPNTRIKQRDSIINSFKLLGKESQLILDYYITDFENKVIVDWERPSNILFYNLEGESFSNSFQAQLTYSIFNKQISSQEDWKTL